MQTNSHCIETLATEIPPKNCILWNEKIYQAAKECKNCYIMTAYTSSQTPQLQLVNRIILKTVFKMAKSHQVLLNYTLKNFNQ